MKKTLLIYLLSFLTAIAAAQDKTEIQNLIYTGQAILQAGRTYHLEGTITIGNNQSLYVPANTTILYNGSASVAIKMYSNSALLGEGKLKSNRTSWNTSWRYGVLIVSSASSTTSNVKVDFGTIEGFEVGIYLKGQNHGVAYNSIRLMHILNSVQGIKLDAFGTDGYINQNHIYVARIGCWSNRFSDPQFQNSYGIYIDSHTANFPNTNRFSGNIIGMKNGIRLCGAYNRIEGMRLAVQGGYKIVIANYSGITTYNNYTSWNWWYSEYGHINWGNDVYFDTNTPYYEDITNPGNSDCLAKRKRQALQGFGVRGIGLWGQEIRIANNIYYGGSFIHNANDVYEKKSNISKQIENPLEKILSLQTSYSVYNTQLFDKDRNAYIKDSSYLVSLKDLQCEMPALVHKMDSNYYINYNGIIPVITEALKEQQNQINTFTTNINRQDSLIKIVNDIIELIKKAIDAQIGANTTGAKIILFSNNPCPHNKELEMYLKPKAKIYNAMLIISNLQGETIKQYNFTDMEDSIKIEPNTLKNGLYLVNLLSNASIIEAQYLIIK
ncbi:MAG: hypothetical protein L3J74_16850 [Bacteroidales bacterium]|nr:hypothetical protein [Bacteroidales bacterium]